MPPHLQRALAADGLPRARHGALPVQPNHVGGALRQQRVLAGGAVGVED